MNGRLEGTPLDLLVAALAGAVPTPGLSLARPQIEGFLDGYVLDRTMSPREAIDPLTGPFGFDARVSGDEIRFVSRRGKPARAISADDLTPRKDASLVSLTRAQESELPHEIALSFVDSELDYQIGQVLSRRLEGYSLRRSEAQSAIMTHRSNAQRIADVWLQDLWVARETAEFSLRPGLAPLQAGDVLSLGGAANGRLFQIQNITDGADRRMSARAVDAAIYDAPALKLHRAATPPPPMLGPARVLVLDLAAREVPAPLAFVAAFADPWPGPLAIWKLANGTFETIGVIEKRAMIGDTLNVLHAGPAGRFDNGSSVTVKFGGGQLASVEDTQALAGRTSMAIKGSDGAWEIFSFVRAELVADNTYRLSRLLRGLGGEESLAIRDVPAGAPVVLLDDAVVPLTTRLADIGVMNTYRIGPADLDYSDPIFVQADVAATTKALMPYAPTQAKAMRTNDGIVISFRRRGRIDSDPWETIDIPLGEENEAYEAQIALPGGATRVLTSTTPETLYPLALELADFGAPQRSLNVSVFQISASVGRGFPLLASLTVH